MILSKEIAVYLNLAACKLKQYTAAAMKQCNLDLTPEQFLLIDILWNQGPMSQQKIADTMLKDKNSVTKLVDAMERNGFVVRERCTEDRRSNIVNLTEKAEKMKLGAKEAGISMLDKILEGIEEDELHDFLGTLAKICDNMGLHMEISSK